MPKPRPDYVPQGYYQRPLYLHGRGKVDQVARVT
jgi:hypothetical protein